MKPPEPLPQGLTEQAVAGSIHKLLGMADPTATPTLEQRVAIARRLNEVGPLLPRYVVTKHNKGESMKKGTASMPPLPEGMPTEKQIEKMHAESAAEVKKSDAEKAKRRAAEEAERKKKADAEAARRKADKAKKEAEKAERRKADAKAAKSGRKKPAAAPKPAPKKAEKKGGKKPEPKKGSIGAFCEDLLVKGKDTEEILAAVKKEFPKARTSAASVAWYRSKLREEGKIK